MNTININPFTFKKCDYLGPTPDNPDWEIVKWVENIYYNKQDGYIKDGDFYYPKDNCSWSIHKSCFKNPKSCYTVAIFYFNEKELSWDLRCFEHIVDFNDEEIIKFWNLIKRGFDYLNNLT